MSARRMRLRVSHAQGRRRRVCLRPLAGLGHPVGAAATPIPTLAAPVPVDPEDRVSPQPRQRTEADPLLPPLRVADAQAHASY